MSDLTSKLLPSTTEGLAQAALYLQEGHLVSFPTETVYGLGANALNADACARIFEAKGRPANDPLIVHVSSLDMGLDLVQLSAAQEFVFRALASTYWPGPLTIVSPSAPSIPPIVTSNTGFVGIRLPSHPIAQELIRVSGLPIAAPSANRFGHVSPTSHLHVLSDLGHVPNLWVIEGSTVQEDDLSKSDEEKEGEEKRRDCEFGIESTVLKLDQEEETRTVIATVLRHGAIPAEELKAFLEACDLSDLPDTSDEQEQHPWCLSFQVKMNYEKLEEKKKREQEQQEQEQEEQGQVAPGQHITHYSPSLPAYLFDPVADLHLLSVLVTNQHRKLIVLSFGPAFAPVLERCTHLQQTHQSLTPPSFIHLSEQGDFAQAAYRLFKSLRECEDEGEQFLRSASASQDENDEEDDEEERQAICLLPLMTSDEPRAFALNDRLYRAASGKLLRDHMQLFT